MNHESYQKALETLSSTFYCDAVDVKHHLLPEGLRHIVFRVGNDVVEIHSPVNIRDMFNDNGFRESRKSLNPEEDLMVTPSGTIRYDKGSLFFETGKYEVRVDRRLHSDGEYDTDLIVKAGGVTVWGESTSDVDSKAYACLVISDIRNHREIVLQDSNQLVPIFLMGSPDPVDVPREIIEERVSNSILKKLFGVS
jgi:hypothetical protein